MPVKSDEFAGDAATHPTCVSSDYHHRCAVGVQMGEELHWSRFHGGMDTVDDVSVAEVSTVAQLDAVVDGPHHGDLVDGRLGGGGAKTWKVRRQAERCW